MFEQGDYPRDYPQGRRVDSGGDESGGDEYGSDDNYSHTDYGAHHYFHGEATHREHAARDPGHRGKGPKDYTRSDERIRDDVCDRLTHHRDLDATEIEVRVENREVTLSGLFALRSQKHLAENLAADVPGVLDVHNHIRLKRDPARPEADDLLSRPPP